jgi:sugar lactone lactonase YvrE
VSIVEDSLDHPNGIAFSPDGKTLYIADSGLIGVGTVATTGGIYNYPIELTSVSTGKRNIYAYDVVGGDNPYLINKRVIFQALEGAPDGLKVAANGYLVVAASLGTGVDILDANGTPLARIQAKHPVANIAWAGDDLSTLWLVGFSGITRVKFALKGPALE